MLVNRAVGEILDLKLYRRGQLNNELKTSQAKCMSRFWKQAYSGSFGSSAMEEGRRKNRDAVYL